METKPFQFLVRTRSPEELAMRVADNVSRGYEVVRYFEVEKESIGSIKSHYKDAEGITRRRNSSSYHKTFGAVMRKVEIH